MFGAAGFLTSAGSFPECDLPQFIPQAALSSLSCALGALSAVCLRREGINCNSFSYLCLFGLLIDPSDSPSCGILSWRKDTNLLSGLILDLVQRQSSLGHGTAPGMP